MTYNSSDWPALPLMSDLINQIHCMDALELLKLMPSNSVNCIVTSPPYWGLRDYGTAGQMGMENTLNGFIKGMVTLFREARRVLRADGVMWLNMGDCYATSANGRSAANTKALGNNDRTFRDKPFSTTGNGLKNKDLVGQPWRLAFALQDDGWYLRSDCIWHKPNPMPASVKDRPTTSHEYVFLMTKSERYYFDATPMKTPVKPHSIKRQGRAVSGTHKNAHGAPGQTPHSMNRARPNSKQDSLGKRTYTGFNERYGSQVVPMAHPRTVWTIPTAQTKEAHFATFPADLIRPLIAAGCPENGIVYDPFMGSGTTALVARALDRNYIGSELNPEYIDIARKRLRMPFELPKKAEPVPVDDLPLFGILEAI